jgi:hypothetical protein
VASRSCAERGLIVARGMAQQVWSRSGPGEGTGVGEVAACEIGRGKGIRVGQRSRLQSAPHAVPEL